MRFRGMVGIAHWNGHQTDREQAPQRSNSSNELWEPRTSDEAS
jgi:hypothetical protein